MKWKMFFRIGLTVVILVAILLFYLNNMLNNEGVKDRLSQLVHSDSFAFQETNHHHHHHHHHHQKGKSGVDDVGSIGQKHDRLGVDVEINNKFDQNEMDGLSERGGAKHRKQNNGSQAQKTLNLIDGNKNDRERLKNGQNAEVVGGENVFGKNQEVNKGEDDKEAESERHQSSDTQVDSVDEHGADSSGLQPLHQR
jgi:hypothetical protein